MQNNILVSNYMSLTCKRNKIKLKSCFQNSLKGPIPSVLVFLFTV